VTRPPLLHWGRRRAKAAGTTATGRALPPVLLLVVPGPSVRGAGLSPPHRASLTAREGPTASPTTTGWAAPAAPRTLVAPRSRRCCASMPSAQAQLAVVVWQGAEVRARARQERKPAAPKWRVGRIWTASKWFMRAATPSNCGCVRKEESGCSAIRRGGRDQWRPPRAF